MSKLHVTLRSNVNGVQRKIPVRGQLATTYLLRRAKRKTWKSTIFENIDFGDKQCFVDVGVNVGQTLLELKAVHPNSCYVGFEPNPYCVYYVEELIRANAFRHCQVNAYALSDAPGAHELHLNDGGPVGAGASLDFSNFGSLARPFNVAALPFDAVRSHFPSPALAKIDVEGHELAVFQGMRECLSRDRPLVLCEILGPGKEAADPPFVHERNDRTISLILSLGYAVFQIVKTGEFDLAPRLEQVTKLARVPYEQSKDLSDYLFVPQEREEILAQICMRKSSRLWSAISPAKCSLS